MLTSEPALLHNIANAGNLGGGGSYNVLRLLAVHRHKGVSLQTTAFIFAFVCCIVTRSQRFLLATSELQGAGCLGSHNANTDDLVEVGVCG